MNKNILDGTRCMRHVASLGTKNFSW